MHFLMSFPLNMVLDVAQNQNNQKIKIVKSVLQMELENICDLPTEERRVFIMATQSKPLFWHNNHKVNVCPLSIQLTS